MLYETRYKEGNRILHLKAKATQNKRRMTKSLRKSITVKNSLIKYIKAKFLKLTRMKNIR